MRPRYDLPHLGADLDAQLERRVPQELVPTLTDLDNGAVSPVEGPLPCTVSHRRPVGAHVGERQRARVGMLEVPDQLVEDPCLLGIVHTAVRVLLDRLGEDHRPRHVVNLHLGIRPQPQSVGRMNTGRRCDLVGDRDHTIMVIEASDLDIRVDLLSFELGVARLHLHESLEPAPATERHPYEAVRSHGAAVGRVVSDLGEGFDCRPGIPSGPQRREQRLRERPHDRQHRKQRGRGASLSLLIAGDPSYGDQSCRLCFDFHGLSRCSPKCPSHGSEPV